MTRSDTSPETAGAATPGGDRAALLEAILPNAIFDGWSDAAFRLAAEQAGIDLALARVLCPRGALDLAADHHRQGDAEMRRRLAAEDLSALRFRDRIARAILLRLEGMDRETVRRAVSLFALPQHAGEATKLMWGTADAIWTALGDSSDDLNWYTKRASLSAVYSATVLYWLNDESEGHEATRDFLDRRIDDVMRFEKLKAGMRNSRLLAPLMSVPLWVAGRVRAPGRMPDDLPGRSAGTTENRP